MNNFSELGRMIETLGKDRGIDKRVVVRAIEQAFLVLLEKNTGSKVSTKLATTMRKMKLKSTNTKTLLKQLRTQLLKLRLMMLVH